MSKQNKNNTFHAILFIVLVVGLLWLTNPKDAIKDCEKVNKVEFCQILDKE